jgi:phage protein D
MPLQARLPARAVRVNGTAWTVVRKSDKLDWSRSAARVLRGAWGGEVLVPNSDAQRLIPDCRVSIAGKKLDLVHDARLTHVDVDLGVDLTGQCALTFNDPKLVLINGKDFDPGVAVKVEIGFAANMTKVFEGEVVALEPQFRRDLPASLRVICQESIHRLALRSNTRALLQVDTKEVASKVAQEHGLTADAPSGTKEHLLQSNVPDSVLLRRLAATSGNHLRIEGKKLVIGPPPKGAAITIGPSDGLKKMKVRFKAGGQITEVSVHGWDPATKREIVSKVKAQGTTGEGSKEHGGNTTLSFATDEHMPSDVATAQAMAQGRMRKLAEAFITAQVEMIGKAEVQPGAEITFEKMGEKLDGTYRVEKAHHDFGKHGYWMTFHAVRLQKKQAPAAKPAPQQPPVKPEPRATLRTRDDVIRPIQLRESGVVVPPPGLATGVRLLSPPNVAVAAESKSAPEAAPSGGNSAS